MGNKVKFGGFSVVEGRKQIKLGPKWMQITFIF